MNLFLTIKEKENLSKWKYSVKDNSITTQIFTPMYNFMARIVPEYIAPNLITFIGFLCTMYAYYLSFNYFDDSPKIISVLVGLLTFAYMCLDAIDGKHARNINCSSPLGELFDHACDNIGSVFMIMNLFMIIGVKDNYTKWFIMNIAQIIFLLSHIEAFDKRIVEFGRFTGPGEFLIVYIILSFVRGFVNIDFSCCLDKVSVYMYCLTLLYSIFRVLELKNNVTKNYLLISFVIRVYPSILILLGVNSPNEINIISSGFIFAVITGDIIIAKMASRELHYLIPIFTALSLSSYITFIITLCYYIIVLTDITTHLNLHPFFGVAKNVYCNGVYDMCHVGHMNLFANAFNYGNRLYVGVHNDNSTRLYKRQPIMTHEERCEVVSKCKYVEKVIPNAPLIIDEDFLKEYNIHVVLCSEEYDKPDDEYYKVPRKMGILKVLPRTEGISTTDLIKRVKAY